MPEIRALADLLRKEHFERCPFIDIGLGSCCCCCPEKGAKQKKKKKIQYKLQFGL